jgi:hypothetical protein
VTKTTKERTGAVFERLVSITRNVLLERLDGRGCVQARKTLILLRPVDGEGAQIRQLKGHWKITGKENEDESWNITQASNTWTNIYTYEKKPMAFSHGDIKLCQKSVFLVSYSCINLCLTAGKEICFILSSN